MGRAPQGVRPKSASLRDAAVGGDKSSKKKVARLASSEPAEPPLRPHCGADADAICPRGLVAAIPSSPRRRPVGDRITLPSSAPPDRGGTGDYTRRGHPRKRFCSFRWCITRKTKIIQRNTDVLSVLHTSFSPSCDLYRLYGSTHHPTKCVIPYTSDQSTVAYPK